MIVQKEKEQSWQELIKKLNELTAQSSKKFIIKEYKELINENHRT